MKKAEHMKEREKRGFTDRMYICNFKFVVLIVLLSFLLIFLKGIFPDIDVSILPPIDIAVIGELSLHTGLIVWKAKAENINKHPNIIKQMQEVDSYASTNS